MLLVRVTLRPRQSRYSLAAKVSTRDRNRLATTSNNNTSQIPDTLDTCDPINGLAVPVNQSMTAITEFANEACDEVSIRGGPNNSLPELYRDTSNVTEVKDYFIRPKLMQTLTYNQTSRGSMYQYDCNAIGAQTNLYNFGRIKGAYGWRATFCFRLQVIATPFQAGIVRMAFSPFANIDDYDRVGYISPVSQLPGVDLDIAQTTSVVLKIPFIHSNNFFIYNNLLTFDQSLGKLVVFAMTPYTAAAGVPAPKIALWHWLEDFELIGAAPYDLVGNYPNASYTADPVSYVESCEGYVAQSGASASTKEGKAIPGNLSNVLAAGSNLTRWIGRAVPSLSSVAGSTSWFLRETSKIAASYGWSRPIAVTVHNKVIDTVNAYQNNADGPDPAYNMGLFSDNAINPVSGFAGTDVDEMAFASIWSIPAVVTVGTLSTTDATGYASKCIPLCPLAMWFQTAQFMGLPNSSGQTNKGKSVFPAPIMSVANCFNKWRGSYKFKVKIAKTKFHTGRIILGYIPHHVDLNGIMGHPIDATQLQYKSLVWDLREANEMEFECPFISPVSYLDSIHYNGVFLISILEPLAAPDSVSQSVPFYVEVSAGDDFEVAVPVDPPFPLSPRDTNYIAQSGLANVFNTPQVNPSAMCIGEKINSVKQMINRAGPVLHMAANDTWSLTSAFHAPVWEPSSEVPGYISGSVPTFLNYFQPLFGLFRGGVVVDAIPIGDAVVTCNMDSFNPGNEIGNFSSVYTESRSALHAKIPFYSNRSRVIVTSNPNTRESYRNFFKMSMSKPDTDASALVYMRAADDYQLGYFRSTAPLCVPPVNYPAFDPLLVDFIGTIATAH